MATTAPRHLAIYLEDHHAGARGGRALLRRLGERTGAGRSEPRLAKLEEELEQDATHLEEVMSRLGVEPSSVKDAGAWLLEKFGRLKPNGHLFERTPLTDLVEVEALMTAVHSKKQMWSTLEAVARDGLGDLDPEKMSAYRQQATDQAQVLEKWHTEIAHELSSSPSPQPDTPPT